MQTFDILKPWVGYNYHFTDQSYLRVNPRMQGPFWIREPGIRQVHSGTRLLYLWDTQSRQGWNPHGTHLPLVPESNSWNPSETTTTLTSSTRGIQTQWIIQCSHERPAELWKLSIKNLDTTTRTLGMSLALPLTEGGHMGSKTSWLAEDSTFCNWSFPLHGDYDEYQRLNALPQYILAHLWPQPQAVSTSARHYFQDQPMGALPGFLISQPNLTKALSDSTDQANNLYPESLPDNSAEPGIFGARYSISLEPEEEWTCIFSLTLQQEQTIDPSLKICSLKDWESKLQDYQGWYEKVSGHLELNSPDPRINTMVNTWLKKEILWETRLWRNGITTPWRNELQDSLGYSLYNPTESKTYLCQVTQNQEPSGYLKVWNTRKGEKPNHPLALKRHTDGGIWLVISWIMAIRVTGNFDWWEEEIPYIDGTLSPLFDHLDRALEFSYQDRGAHGFVHFHDGDWTDPFNGPGRQGKGESGWATQALIFAMKQFANLATELKVSDLAEKYKSRAEGLQSYLEAHLWTGNRYAYGFDDQGERFGDDSDGRTYLNSQSWGLLAHPETSHGPEICSTLETLSTPYGPKLLAPAFQGWDPQAGRISLKIPGTTENGSVYCHGSIFAAYGLAKAGYVDQALDLVERTIPGHRDHRKDLPQQLPIYQPNSYFCFPGYPQDGLSTGTLGTGTCTWMVLLIFEQFLGISFTPKGLTIDPKLPKDWPEVILAFTRKSTKFRIKLVRQAGSEKLDTLAQPRLSFKVNGKLQGQGPIEWEGVESIDLEVVIFD